MKFNTKFDDLSLRTQSILGTAVVLAVVSTIIYTIILFPIILGISIVAFGIGMILCGVYVNVNLALRRRKWRLRYPQKED
jgi:hypothetical protein